MNTVKKFLAAMITVLTLLGCMTPADAEVTENSGFVVVLETGVADKQPEVSDPLKDKIFERLAELGNSYRLRDLPLTVITTNTGQPVWSSKVKDLRSVKGNLLRSLTRTRKNKCSNLVPALKSASEAIKMMARQGADTITVVVLAPMINVPCNLKSIRLPQSAPSYDIAKALMHPSVSNIYFFGVHPTQIPIYNEKLSELDQWRQQPDKLFLMFDRISTESNLNLIGN